MHCWRFHGSAVAVLLLMLFSSQAWSEEPGNAQRGLTYTQVHCAGCHAVDGRQPQRPPVLGIATFTEIANTPGMTPIALVVWFQSPHPNMPNLVLERADRDDVIAYITSLRSAQ